MSTQSEDHLWTPRQGSDLQAENRGLGKGRLADALIKDPQHPKGAKTKCPADSV